MPCPHLRYRASSEDHEFDHDRPYCTVVDAFASPMRADVCNDRHEFHHETHCDTYRQVAEQAPDVADVAAESDD